MILVCPKTNALALAEADKELTLLSRKIITENRKIKIKNIIRDCFKSFPYFFQLMFKKNGNKNVYIAVITVGGIGDILRQKDAILKLAGLFPSVVIDVYNRGSKSLLTDVKNVRFFFHVDAIVLTYKKYDVVLDYFNPGKVASGIADLKINNLKNDIVKNFADDFEKIRKRYSYCFCFKNQYLFQKEAVKKGLKINDVMKLTAGIKDIKKNNIVLNYKEQDITKFGLSKEDKYITFQHGWGDKGYISGKTGWNVKLWETAKWEKLLAKIKKDLKIFKIVQVGINSDYLKETDINLNGKTSYDELCSIIKYSSLHIDIDGGCSHIARALNVKSVILFGPTNAKYIGYDDNINIVSGLCTNCYSIVEDWDLKCMRGFEKPLCMDSISPEFVAKAVLEYMMKM
jgi:ADP-heptose:LPS heptosyltransferase